MLSLLHYTRLLETDGVGPQDVRLWSDTGWRQAMTMGVPGYAVRSLEDPELRVSYERFKHLMPVLPCMTHPSGAQNVITHAAKGMLTSFRNHLWVSIMPRLRRLCNAWVAKRCSRTRTRCPFSALSLLRAIESNTQLQDAEGDAFVAEVRATLALGPKQKLTKQFAKGPARRTSMLFFLRWIQLRLQTLGVRGIRLMPVFRGPEATHLLGCLHPTVHPQADGAGAPGPAGPTGDGAPGAGLALLHHRTPQNQGNKTLQWLHVHRWRGGQLCDGGSTGR